MGLFKTDNSTHTNIFVSKEAAKEQRKAAEEQHKAAERNARALEEQAYQERRAVEIQANKEVKLEEMRQTAERAKDLRELAQEGTAEAYCYLFNAYSKEQYKDVKNRTSTLKSQLTGIKEGFDNFEDVQMALDSFPFTKIPGELEKIYIFLVQKCKKQAMGVDGFAIKQLENLETVAEMNVRDPEIAKLLPSIQASLSELKQKQKESLLKILKYFGIGLLSLILLGIIIAIFS